MNFLFILVGFCATFGLIGLIIGIKSQHDADREHRVMPRSRTTTRLLCAFISILGFVALCPSSLAQQVVHAMGGTVTAVDAKSLTLTMQSDQGYTTRFQALPKAKADTMLDKQVAALSSPAEQLAKVGDHVVVLYIGDNTVLSALAIEDLGPAPTAQHDGTVAAFDRHSRVVTLKGGPTPDAVTLSEKTVVDTPDGVTTGLKYKPSKGDHIQVKSAQGAQDALFLSVAT
jgi:hypothetical protein